MVKLKLKVLALLGGILRRVLKDKIRTSAGIIYTGSELVRDLPVALLFFGKYEKEEIFLCDKYLNMDIDIGELGTSIDVVASIIKKNGYGKRMLCVEANPKLIDSLRKTFDINGLQEIDLHHLAISDSNEPIYFSTRGSNELGEIVPYSDIKVSSKSLSLLLKENNIEHYQLVSDIEGAECSFINGDGLEDCQLTIIELHKTEWNGIRYTVADLVEKLSSRGFKVLEQINYTYVFKRA